MAEYVLIGSAIVGATSYGIRKIKEHNQKIAHRQYISELNPYPNQNDIVPVVQGNTMQPINMDPYPALPSGYPSSINSSNYMPNYPSYPMLTPPLQSSSSYSSYSQYNYPSLPPSQRMIMIPDNTHVPISSNYYVTEPPDNYSVPTPPSVPLLPPSSTVPLLTNEPNSIPTDPIIESQAAALASVRYSTPNQYDTTPPGYRGSGPNVITPCIEPSFASMHAQYNPMQSYPLPPNTYPPNVPYYDPNIHTSSSFYPRHG